MPRYILLSFLFMGWAFYELSGGADFGPGSGTEEIAETSVVQPVTAATRTKLDRSRRERAAQAAVLASARRQPVERTNGRTNAGTVVTRAGGPAVKSEQPKLAFLQPGKELAGKAAAIFNAAPEPIVEPEQPVAPKTAIRLPATQAADLREVAATRVNMRAGPGTAHDILARLGRGQNVEVLENNGSGWLRLRTLPDDQVGWIAERLISRAN